jgi:hypothetical protein
MARWKEENKMKTTKRSMASKVVVMVVTLSLMSAPVFAATLSSLPISPSLGTKTVLWPSYLVLYNDSGQDVYDVCISKLMYVDVNGFFHWEKIMEISQIALHAQVKVRVPSDAGLLVDYCVGQDGCSGYARESTGSFGPVRSGTTTTVTLR